MRKILSGGLVGVLVCSWGCQSPRSGVLTSIPRPIEDTISRPVERIGRPPATRARRKHFVPRLQPPIEQARNWRPPNGISSRWKTIVIHHSASDKGNAALFDAYHRNVNGWEEMGYHFVIGNGRGSPDGLIEVGSRWGKQKHGAHCKSSGNFHNEHGIGICLVGNFENTGPSDAQMRSLIRLLRYLTGQTGIRPEQVVTHSGVTGKTRCPGRNFRLLAVKQAIGVPTGASVMQSSR